MNINQLNKKYEEEAVGIFPFVGPERITILEKGLYTKNKTKYKGLSYIYDKFDEQHKTMLLGYYSVPENVIVVPENIEITSGKQRLIDVHLSKGFLQVNKCPSLKPISFSEDTDEYRAAFDSYKTYKNQQNDSLNN